MENNTATAPITPATTFTVEMTLEEARTIRRALDFHAHAVRGTDKQGPIRKTSHYFASRVLTQIDKIQKESR